jgi:alpha,alpha-trehalase
MQEFTKKITTGLHRAQIHLAPKKDSPDDLWGELFQDVQLRRIFPDSMTFADMLPAQAQRRILKAYRKQRQDPHFDLPTFIGHNFTALLNEEQYTSNPHHNVQQHIEELWGVLRRDIPRNTGSLIGLPHPYIVAGGRYTAQYYWDSYFTMIGLAAGGHVDMVENTVKNCAFLIRKFGFVPNGNRTYYLTRSQPPVFALMVQLLAKHTDKSVLVRYLPYLLAEYRFWMKGRGRLDDKKLAFARVVRMPSGAVLNRYYDNGTTPRPEGYKEDVALAIESGRTPSRVYLDLRAGAESGWDYTSRWLRDDRKLSSIHTTDIVPIDLNSLLYTLEQTIADAYDVYKQKRLASRYRGLAAVRAAAINTYCWDEQTGFYYDYDMVAGKRTGMITAAALFPLFAGIAEQSQADGTASMVYKKLLQPGGLVTSLDASGQQWDWPNGWAPLQWVAIQGLRQYGHHFLAEEIKQRWIKTNLDLYRKEGKLVEKYNVVEPDSPPLNGEYVLQDGFGWTNGVLQALLTEDANEN